MIGTPKKRRYLKGMELKIKSLCLTTLVGVEANYVSLILITFQWMVPLIQVSRMTTAAPLFYHLDYENSSLRLFFLFFYCQAPWWIRQFIFRPLIIVIKCLNLLKATVLERLDPKSTPFIDKQYTANVFPIKTTAHEITRYLQIFPVRITEKPNVFCKETL